MALNDQDKQRYLDALAECGVRSTACKQAGVSTTSVSKWLRNDPEFALAYDEAIEESLDLLESEARRRAFEGVDRTRYVGTGENAREYIETTYSDTLLIFLLKGGRPDKFADRQKQEISGPGGQPVELAPTVAAARLASILSDARQRVASPDTTTPVRDDGVDPLS